MRVALSSLLILSIWAVTTVEGAEVRELSTKLKSKDSDVRRAAAKDLGELGAEAEPATAELAKAMKDRDLFVRRFAAEALGNIGPAAKKGIPALTLALNDTRKEV